MFCPQCGTTQPDELNFCKSCGAHLQGVRTALEKPDAGGDFRWDRTWLAETLMTRDEKDRIRGMTPEMKRRREIKAGIITASTGVGLTIATFVIMEGIIASGSVTAAAIAILSRVWIAGLIPFLIGLALIFNGLVVSKKKTADETIETNDAKEIRFRDPTLNMCRHPKPISSEPVLLALRTTRPNTSTQQFRIRPNRSAAIG